MNKQEINDIITCPYCGSELTFVIKDKNYNCDFCIMQLDIDQVQRNYERVSVRVRDYALEVYLEKSTPELMRYSTYELLYLLKYARTERSNIYKLLNTFYKGRIQEKINDYKELEDYSGNEYENITRKMFVIENIIRERLGYVPTRITNTYLDKYLAEIKKDKCNPMIIRKERKI